MTNRQLREQEVQIERYQFLSREVTDPLAACCFASLSKNLKPTWLGIETSVRAVSNVGGARKLKFTALLFCTSEGAIDTLIAHCGVAARDLLMPDGDVIAALSHGIAYQAHAGWARDRSDHYRRKGARR